MREASLSASHPVSSFGCCCATMPACEQPAEAAGGHAPASTRGSTRSAQPPRLRTRLSCRQYTIRATNATRSEIESSGIKQPQRCRARTLSRPVAAAHAKRQYPSTDVHAWEWCRGSRAQHAHGYSAGVQGSTCTVRVFILPILRAPLESPANLFER